MEDGAKSTPLFRREPAPILPAPVAAHRSGTGRIAAGSRGADTPPARSARRRAQFPGPGLREGHCRSRRSWRAEFPCASTCGTWPDAAARTANELLRLIFNRVGHCKRFASACRSRLMARINRTPTHRHLGLDESCSPQIRTDSLPAVNHPCQSAGGKRWPLHPPAVMPDPGSASELPFEGNRKKGCLRPWMAGRR